MLTAEQRAVRHHGIGASEIGCVVGAAGAYDTSLALWARKTGRIPEADETDTPEFIELGNLLEPVIAALYTRRTGRELYEPGTLVHPKDPLRIATPDRLVRGEPMGVQIKKARLRGAWGQEGTDEVPEAIIAQCQWEMSVADLVVEDVPVLMWGSHLGVYTVKRDDVLIEGLAELAHRWWRDHVVADVPPQPDGSERTRETLTKMFHGSGRMTTLTVEGVLLATQYAAERDLETAHRERKEEIGNQLRLLIGDADGFAWPTGKATWTRDASGKPSWKAIAEELGATPELVAKHTSPPGRTLRVNLKPCLSG